MIKMNILKVFFIFIFLARAAHTSKQNRSNKNRYTRTYYNIEDKLRDLCKTYFQYTYNIYFNSYFRSSSV